MLRGNRAHSLTECNALTHNVMVEKLQQISKRKDMEEVIEKFKGMDEDNNKLINIQEFVALAKNIPMLQDQDFETLKETFRNIDVDESGELTISEFHSFYTKLKVLKKKTNHQTPYPEHELIGLHGLQFIRKYL